MSEDEDAVVRAVVDALKFLTRYVDEREVPDEVADDDVKALESVAAYLSHVPAEARPGLIALIGADMAEERGLLEDEAQDESPSPGQADS